jgi:hypothetical protein
MALAAALLGGGKVPFISWGTESELFSRMTDVGGKVEWRTTRALYNAAAARAERGQIINLTTKLIL